MHLVLSGFYDNILTPLLVVFFNLAGLFWVILPIRFICWLLMNFEWHLLEMVDGEEIRELTFIMYTALAATS